MVIIIQRRLYSVFKNVLKFEVSGKIVDMTIIGKWRACSCSKC